ncbi:MULTISPECIES: bifunctional ornithine acetyltransferase/N-acetylglutamate synthase [unclassified Clostridium]|uniref:bifunctional ornithine acetyltransferase/N-acetylglutamate synthase n=1 Tax=unclassified Clostridium TaxID=2614128 RepID=UPI001C8BB31A|nr:MULTISPECIES: bifunctional ornithine acetyltransferase/N-acetylglutamate synthase [unclassified Clostridium]MBX9137248.1 bifunctional ornithine acetyltransferase/N-acetylglutamate synthase [Clostridium sp. K12(2020)]MBX9144059.1 bifunctional ornithine acetyltransferase/N-acetylglutamate synthase [Clostridium sp. K13]
MINIDENLTVTSPAGFKASGVHCGLKKSLLKKDLALIYSDVVATSCGVYTKNKVKGAPLTVTKQHLVNKKAQAIIINSGNANTCNGDDGLSKAKKMANLCAKELNIKNDNVLVASTGVIGVPLNIDVIKDGIPQLVNNLSSEIQGAKNASMAIMTTDTIEKQAGIEIEVGGKKITIAAMAKGSGMIHPNMATMLSFITTDISISPALLKEALKQSVNISYNRISVDGDSSTNDMVLIMANGLADNETIIEKNEDYNLFLEALTTLNIYISKKIAKDGEGATKLIECTVSNANSIEDAETLSKSVVTSSLVKAAIFGSDANWGRILCALGYSGIDFDPEKVDVSFASNAGEIIVCIDGSSVNFDEAKAKEILLQDEIKILIDMKQGLSEVTTWGCDLTYDYVKINGDYRS